MFKIINKQVLAKDIKRLDITAENIARKIQPGQFVSICPEEGDESIPLTVVDHDEGKGVISLIFKEVGTTTRKLGALTIKEKIFSILGPLGVPAQIHKRGTVICIATGVGVAQMLPVCRALKEKGNKIIGIIGAKNKKELMIESQMRIACDKIYITTQDSSYERRGLATDIFKDLIQKQKIHLVYAIGAVEMMRTVCSLTKIKTILTLVHLNPVMVDCMGMCGSCRVKVGGKTVLACVEGPQFDGHKVDFDYLNIRMNAFEEAKEWDNQKSQPSQKETVSKILTRFLSGILKE